jgi:hypothetical protein
LHKKNKPMKPFKAGKGVANWILRISLVLTMYLLYWNSISTLRFTNPSFIINFTLVLFSLLLVVGGLFSKSWLTIISGLIIALLTLYKMAISFNGFFDHGMITQLIPFSIGFYFVTNGDEN